jgi:hypothetical protein
VYKNCSNLEINSNVFETPQELLSLLSEQQSMIEFGKFCNYRPISSLHFGGTCARKGFEQDSVSSLSTTLNHKTHILNSMEHCQKVSNTHYTDHDGCNRMIPQNILQKNVNAESVLSIIEKHRVAPAYKDKNFFDLTKTPNVDDIASPLELLENWMSLMNMFALQVLVLCHFCMKVILENI